jgi:hypothetical protein
LLFGLFLLGWGLAPSAIERAVSLLPSPYSDRVMVWLKKLDNWIENVHTQHGDAIASLRSKVEKLLRFPNAVTDQLVPPTLIEKLIDQLPRRLFDLLVDYDESDIKEVQGIGRALCDHLVAYYHFRNEALAVESDLLSKIGPIAYTRIGAGWQIYLRYAAMRFSGMSKEHIAAGPNFLNYGITLDHAESVFAQLSGDTDVATKVANLFTLHDALSQGVAFIAADM